MRQSIRNDLTEIQYDEALRYRKQRMHNVLDPDDGYTFCVDISDST
jgi:hypothetical protein